MISWLERKNTIVPVRPADVLARLHLEGQWAAARTRAEADAKLRALAEREGIVPPPDAVQRAVDDHRDRLGLRSRQETLDWMKRAGLRLTQLVEFVRIQVQSQALLAATPAAAVREWFDEHGGDYDAVLLSVISFTNESDAWLARTAAEQSPEAFHDVAWSRSQADPRLPLGGALGWRLRSQLPPTLASQIFAEGDGLIGPVVGGSLFYLYRVWARRTASLTPAVEAQCRRDYVADRLKTLP